MLSAGRGGDHQEACRGLIGGETAGRAQSGCGGAKGTMPERTKKGGPETLDTVRVCDKVQYWQWGKWPGTTESVEAGPAKELTFCREQTTSTHQG